MATYKVIQDIEADDKFVGPLTLKQFVFACSGVLFGYLNIFAIQRGAAVLMAIFLPPMFLAFFLAIPWSRDQPTEMWVLARLKFMFKPKKRIWDQSGLQELVTITAPKKIERNLTKNYTEGEVKSRLKALAETIDSRGWAVKHATAEDSQISSGDFVSDRLVDPSVLPQDTSAVDLDSVPDVMDPSNNPLSGNLQSMIQASGSKRKSELLQKMDRARRGEPLENIQQEENIAVNQHQAPKTPQPKQKPAKSMDEQLLNEQLHAKKQAGDLSRSHMRGLQTQQPQSTSDNRQKMANRLDNKPEEQTQKDKNKAQAAMTEAPSPDTIRLASSNDLNIETVAREANREEGQDGEVVIPLR